MDASGSNMSIILALVFLTFLSGFFSASETAFSSVNRLRLKSLANNGNVRAKRALELSDRYDELLSTILIGNNIVNILSASLATVVFTNFFGAAGVSLSTVVMTVIILIFGEISPKSLAKERAEAFTMALTPVLHVLMLIFTPLNWFFAGWKKLMSRVIRPSQDRGVTEEELITFVNEVQNEGGLDEHESNLIRSAIEFNDRDVEDILTPRVDVEAVDVSDSPEEIEQKFKNSGFSRLPVYGETVDDVVGVLHEKDFYAGKGKTDVRDMISAPTCVMPNTKISALLRLLQKTKSHMAIVMDEYGSMIGIVTMEDILEELVGEIWDEHDEVIEEFQKLPDGSYRIACSANLEKMLEMFNINREYDSATVSGWVIEEIGQIPKVGDEFTFQNLHVIVEKVDGRRVLEIRVVVLNTPKAADEEE